MDPAEIHLETDLSSVLAQLDAPRSGPSFDLPATRMHQHRTAKEKIKATRRGIQALVKPENAQAIVACLPEHPDDRTHAVLCGDFVLCDLIPALLAQRGRTPHLRIATLSMSSANAAELARLVALGLVGDITIVCSHYFAQVDKATTFREVTARLAGLATICVCRVHCKVICIPTVTEDTYVIEGSANLRSSDNTEQIVITNDPATHQFHASWIDDLVKKHG